MQDSTDQHRDDTDPQADDAFGTPPQPALALDEDERLPWLESADDEDDAGAVDIARITRFAFLGIAVMALIGGGLWLTGRSPSADAVAEGGVIKAPAEPYKAVPTDQGGKTYAGTGDSVFVVSEGKNPAARLNEGGAPVTAPLPGPSLAAGANAPAETGGIGVQVGAYSSQALAEAGWQRLSGANEALGGLRHRVVEGSADIGTVYRLQAITADTAAANALCSALKAKGIACQVKR